MFEHQPAHRVGEILSHNGIGVHCWPVGRYGYKLSRAAAESSEQMTVCVRRIVPCPSEHALTAPAGRGDSRRVKAMSASTINALGDRELLEGNGLRHRMGRRNLHTSTGRPPAGCVGIAAPFLGETHRNQ